MPNKSLERTAAESVFLPAQMLGGCRSALRWTAEAANGGSQLKVVCVQCATSYQCVVWGG